MANLINKFKVKTLVLTSIASLALQLKNELQSWFKDIKVGICTGDQIDYDDALIIVGTPKSLLNHSDLLLTINALFVDECHLLPALQMFSVANECRNAYYRIGLSASPWRDDGLDLLLTSAINVRNPAKSILSSELIQKGVIMPVEFTYYRIPSIFNSNDYQQVYEKNIVTNPQRNAKIVEIAQKHEKDSTLILFKSIKHGKILLQMLRSKINNEFFMYKGCLLNTIMLCDGSDPISFREVVFQAVRENKVKILLGSTIADTGLSISNLSVLILAGGGKSSTRAFQRVGRVLRRHPNKEKAYVYDFWDENPILNRHSQLRWNLMSIESEFKQTLID